MSGMKSRLGKGLGALFPALPGEDDLVSPQVENQNVSRETNDSSLLDSKKDSRKIGDSNSSVQNSGDNTGERDNLNADVEQSYTKSENNAHIYSSKLSVSHETKVPSMNRSIAPHSDESRNTGFNNNESKILNTLQSKKNPKSSKRSSMPSLEDVTRPIDFFFGDSAERTFVSDKNKSVSHETNNNYNVSAEDKNNTETAQNQGLKPVEGGYLAYIKPSDIVPNAQQPRLIFDEDELKELAASIKEVGVLQPIVVRKIEKSDSSNSEINVVSRENSESLDNSQNNELSSNSSYKNESAHYELIMGERRWRASQLAGLDVVPAIVRTTPDENMLRDALLENLHRVALNPLEEAAAYAQMIDDFGLTQAQLSQSVSKSRPQIANTLRLLNLPASVQKQVASGLLSSGHARALLGLESSEEMESVAKRIIDEGLSVRTTEEIVSLKGVEAGRRSTPTRRQRNDRWSSSPIRSQLEKHFSTKVSIKGTPQHGHIEIVFSSPEDMNRIVQMLMPNQAE